MASFPIAIRIAKTTFKMGQGPPSELTINKVATLLRNYNTLSEKDVTPTNATKNIMFANMHRLCKLEKVIFQ